MKTAFITVTNEHGDAALLERISPSQLQSEHFRAQLAERVAWAVDDVVAEPADSEPAPVG